MRLFLLPSPSHLKTILITTSVPQDNSDKLLNHITPYLPKELRVRLHRYVFEAQLDCAQLVTIA